MEKFRVVREAEALILQKKFDLAVKQYQSLLESQSEDPMLWNSLGDLQLKCGNQGEAVTAFQKAAEAFIESGFTTKAIAVCKKVTLLDPTNVEVNDKLIALFADKGLPLEQKRQLEGSVNRFIQQGNSAKALTYQEQLAALEPDEPRHQEELSRMHVQMENKEEAALCLVEVARLYRRQNRDDLARSSAEEALLLDSNCDAARRILSGEDDFMPEFSESGGQEEAAPESASEAESAASGFDFQDFGSVSFPPLSEPSPEPGAERVELDSLSEFFAQTEEATQETSEPPSAPSTGVQIESMGWPLGEAETTEVSSEGRVEEVLQEIEFYSKLGLTADAKRLINELVESHPRNPSVRELGIRMGIIEAAPAEGPAAEVRPGEAERESEVLEELPFESALDKALDELFGAEVRAESPDVLRYEVPGADEVEAESDPKVHLDLGLAYKEMGLLEDAAEKFKDAFGISEGLGQMPQQILCCTLLAETLLQSGADTAALEWSEKGLRLPHRKDFESRALFYDRSIALERLGRISEALDGFLEISERYPDYRDVREHLYRLSQQSDVQ